MRYALACMVVAVASARATTAHAQATFDKLSEDDPTPSQPKNGYLPDELVPGTFTTLGSPHRMWELRSDTSFGELRAFTQRFELAHVIPVSRYGLRTDPNHGVMFGIVLRASFGLADQTTTGFYSPEGPQPAIGARMRTRSDNEWIEGGLRLLIGYPGPQNAERSMQSLALNATLTSGTADDATWLPLSSTGAQVYLATQARTNTCGPDWLRLAFGLTGGGAASIVPMSVSTALGPVKGFIGNIWAEMFLTVVSIRQSPINAQLGGHVEASLSSFWPGADTAPILFNAFIGWSPVYPVAVRVFYGNAFSPIAGVFTAQYGLRLQVYFP